MRWTVAVVAALLLAGCSSKDEPEAQIGIPATDLAAGNITQTVFPLQFAGGTREADLLFSETFAPTDGCTFGFPECPAASQRQLDLVPAIPADAPVELIIQSNEDQSIDLQLMVTETTILRMSEDSDNGASSISALLVRAAAGTVTLHVTFGGFVNPDPVNLEIRVHSVTRSDVVPSFLPVAIELGPGDIVNATGDGLEHFVAIPPTGLPLRAVQFPFSLQVPEDGARGTWFLIGDADEAIRMTGPNRTLSARLLEFTTTEPVDLMPNQATSFTMDVVGQPLAVGLEIESKPSAAGFFSGASLLGNYEVSMRTPGQVEVLGTQATCTPWCDFALLRSLTEGFQSAFLSEHLLPGVYEATVTLETANDLQAYAWAISIKST
ncbi:MAG: hypothetical protein ACYC2H_12295 [Thermoplasmatota archaeon]